MILAFSEHYNDNDNEMTMTMTLTLTLTLTLTKTMTMTMTMTTMTAMTAMTTITTITTITVASCSSKKHELVENVLLNFNRHVELKQSRQTERYTGHRNGDWMDQEKVEADRILLWRMGGVGKMV